MQGDRSESVIELCKKKMTKGSKMRNEQNCVGDGSIGGGRTLTKPFTVWVRKSRGWARRSKKD